MLARSRYLGRVQVMFVQQFPRRRAGFRGLFGRWRFCFCIRMSFTRCGRLGGDLCNHLAGNDGSALFLYDAFQNTAFRCRHLEYDLVGLDIHQVLILFDSLSRLFVPCRNHSVTYGLR